MLNFKLKSWEAETAVAYVTITRISDNKFYWHAYYKLDDYSVEGHSESLGKAKWHATLEARAAE